MVQKAETRLTGRVSGVFLVLAYGPVRDFFCLQASVSPRCFLISRPYGVSCELKRTVGRRCFGPPKISCASSTP